MPKLTCPKCKSEWTVAADTAQTACPQCRVTIKIKAVGKKPDPFEYPKPVVRLPDVPTLEEAAPIVAPVRGPLAAPIPVCQGCNHPVAGYAPECPQCTILLCSEACLERHFRITGHGRGGIQAQPAQQTVNVVMHNTNASAARAVSQSSAWGMLAGYLITLGILIFLPLLCCGFFLTAITSTPSPAKKAPEAQPVQNAPPKVVQKAKG